MIRCFHLATTFWATARRRFFSATMLSQATHALPIARCRHHCNAFVAFRVRTTSCIHLFQVFASHPCVHFRRACRANIFLSLSRSVHNPSCFLARTEATKDLQTLQSKLRVHMLTALRALARNILRSSKCSHQRFHTLDISLFFQCRTALTAIARKRWTSETCNCHLRHALPRA